MISGEGNVRKEPESEEPLIPASFIREYVTSLSLIAAVTFAGMIIVGALIGILVTRSREHAETLHSSRLRYIPLRSSQGVIGIMGIRPTEPGGIIAPEQVVILTAFANLTAQALERVRLTKQPVLMRNLQRLNSPRVILREEPGRERCCHSDLPNF